MFRRRKSNVEKAMIEAGIDVSSDVARNLLDKLVLVGSSGKEAIVELEYIISSKTAANVNYFAILEKGIRLIVANGNYYDEYGIWKFFVWDYRNARYLNYSSDPLEKLLLVDHDV